MTPSIPEDQQGAVLLKADEAMKIAARLMSEVDGTHPAGVPMLEDARAVYTVAGNLKAACELASARIQTDDRLYVPEWMVEFVATQQKETPS